MNRIASLALVLGIGLTACGGAAVQAASEVYAPFKSEEVRVRLERWLSEQRIPEPVRQQITAVWKSVDDAASAERLLEALIQSFALADSDAKSLILECNAPPTDVVVARPDALRKSVRGPFFQANLGLFYGRYLVERRMYDEAWDVLKELEAQQVVDPASLFFFQAVAAQGMLELKPALEAIDQLLTNTEKVPVRYAATAELMQVDLKAMKEKSLNEIARLMADSERRLELGRAGEKVQEVQERIISNLDEIIKKIEQQQGGSSSNSNGSNEGGDTNQSSGPADDSRVKGAPGAGEVDKKKFDNKGSWGNLPDKDLTKAKSDLNKLFPSHYEQAIEKYTRKLATRQAKKK